MIERSRTITIIRLGYVIHRGPSATKEIRPQAPARVKRKFCQKVREYLLFGELENSDCPELSTSFPFGFYRNYK